MTDPLPVPDATSLAQASDRNSSTLLAQGVQVGCRIVSVLLVARMVTPAEHGLFAMAASVTYFLVLFRDFGLGTAAVQKQNLSREQLRALYCAQTSLGLFLAVLTAALAPLAAWFYATPTLAPLLLAMSVTFALMGASAFPRAQLARDLRFVTLARIDMTGAVTATGAMIAAAAMGAGAYSYVVFMLASEFCGLVLCWAAHRRRPTGQVTIRSLRELLHVGVDITGYHVVNCLLMNADSIAIGYALGPRELGFFNRPAQLLALASQHVANPLAQVALATLSRIGTQQPAFNGHVRSSLTTIAHLTFPVSVVGAIMPHEVVRLALGNQWGDSVPILRWLAMVSAVGGVTALAFAVNVAAGQTRRLFWSAFLPVVPTVAAIAIGLPDGVAGVARNVALTSLVLAGPRWWWMLRGSPVSLTEFFGALWGPLVAGGALAVGLSLGQAAAASAHWLVRLAFASVAGVVGITLVAMFWARLRGELRGLLALLPRRKAEVR